MGEPIRWSVSVDKETDAIAEILQRAFAEYVGTNRSRLVCFLFKRFHRMAGNVAAQLEAEQGINQAISSEEIINFNNSSQQFPVHAAPEGRAKPLTRISSASQQRTPGARRREVSGVSQRRAVGEAKGRAWGTSFPLNSTRVSWRAA